MSTRAVPKWQWSLLIRSLERGGAERQVIVLAKALRERGHDVRIVTFYDGGSLRHLLDGTDVPVVSLAKKGRWDVVGFLYRLARTLNTPQPQILYSFLTVSNIIAALLRPVLRHTHVLWGIRASNMDLAHYDWFARVSARVERGLAFAADVIIANSNAGRDYALGQGFPRDKTVVVPNGIDTELFRPRASERRELRNAWNVSEQEVLVGLAGRIDPMKDHATFIKAAALLRDRVDGARFVCVGAGTTPDALEQHQELAETHGIADALIWAGPRDDMPAVYSALDIAVSSSRFGEGFSNAIAEAMSCGTPCLATDVGDAREVIGDTGRIVPPGNAAALANGLAELILLSARERLALGLAARHRIEQRFSVEQLAARTVGAAALAIPAPN